MDPLSPFPRPIRLSIFILQFIRPRRMRSHALLITIRFITLILELLSIPPIITINPVIESFVAHEEKVHVFFPSKAGGLGTCCHRQLLPKFPTRVELQRMHQLRVLRQLLDKLLTVYEVCAPQLGVNFVRGLSDSIEHPFQQAESHLVFTRDS